jgi:ligand-binding sensor domain-containing protein
MQTTPVLLVTAFILSLLGSGDLLSQKATPTIKDMGIPKLINPEAKSPFPYDRSIDKSISDKTGNLWFGTTKGLYRYDGKLFTNYRVIDGMDVDHITHMLEDKAGNIWFGVHGGLICYDLAASLRVGSPVFSSNKIQSDPSKRSKAGSGDMEAKDAIWEMMADEKGAIWFTVGSDVYRSNGNSGTALTTSIGNYLRQDKVPYRCTYPEDFGICALYQDKQGNILISTTACSCGHNISYRLDHSKVDNPCILNTCKHDLYNWQDYAAHNIEIAASFTKVKTAEGDSDLAFMTAYEDRSGKIWIGADRGVYLYEGGHFVKFSANGILDKSVVNNIYQDKKGCMWFGTSESEVFRGNGVFRYDPSLPIDKSITQFTSKDGLCDNGPFKNDIISAIFEDKAGRLWVSGDGGASYFNGKGFTSLTTKNGFTEQPVKSTVKDKQGNLWFGTWAFGLYRYDGKALKCYTEYKD